MLEINNLNVFYGKIQALKNVCMHAPYRQIVTIIGANGAGKTSILKGIIGLAEKKSGEIKFKDTRIECFSPDRIVKMGISLVPEGRRIYPEFDVRENLKIGAYTKWDRKTIENGTKRIFDIFPVLLERRNQLGSTLSGGEQQMLAIGRGMMSMPELLLLDEPSLGLAPKIIKELFRIIKDINNNGTTIILVEQNAEKALRISDKVYVMETGEIKKVGSPSELMSNDEIRRVYLGINK